MKVIKFIVILIIASLFIHVFKVSILEARTLQCVVPMPNILKSVTQGRPKRNFNCNYGNRQTFHLDVVPDTF